MALASWTTQQIIDQLDSGHQWSGGTITYAFPTVSTAIYGGQGETLGFTALNATQKAQAELALDLWDDVIVPAVVATSASSYTSANIEFGMGTSGISFAHAYQPGVGSVWFSKNYSDLVTPVVGKHGFLTYIHEIGHALGLDHMGNYNGSGSWTPSSYQDSGVYSVMSYFGPNMGSGSAAGEGSVAWADWIGADGQRYSPQTPMVNDILALQTMYGADPTTRTGDTVYGFSSNVTGTRANIYNFSLNLNPILTIYDAAGSDTLNLSGWSTASTVDLAPGAYSSGNSMTDNIAIAYSCNIENAICGSADDSLSGNALANRLDGGAGDDVLAALDGDDTLLGGAGDDSLNGGNGNDTVVFTGQLESYVITYNDISLTYSFTSLTTGVDTVSGVENFIFADGISRSGGQLIGQTFNGSTGNDVMSGTAGDDHLNGDDGRDVLNGLSGVDVLDGGAGIDTMIGGYGNDTYVVDHVLDIVRESAGIYGGTDLVQASATCTLATYVENLTLTGSADINGSGNVLVNTLIGNSGNNILDGKAGEDNYLGGLGNDTYVVDRESELTRITENAGEGSDTLKVMYANATGIAKNLSLSGALSELENIVLGATGLFNLTGNAADNALTGNASSNQLLGGDGNDTLDGKLGADLMSGGVGDDIYVVDNLADVLDENAGEGTDLVRLALTAGGKTYTLGSNFENATLVTGAANHLEGNAADNVLTGNAAGNRLDGLAGADTLVGAGGADTYVVDDAGDVIVESSTSLAEIDSVVASVDWTLGGNLEKLTLSGTDHLTATGNALKNRLTGNAGNNRLDGGAGIDILIGLGGDDDYVIDHLLDQTSETTVYGGAIDAGGNDTVHSSVSWTLGKYIENLTLTGSTNLNATGNTLDNRLTGNTGNNLLNGGLGADTLAGDLGDDSYVVDNVGDSIVEAAGAGSDSASVLIVTAGATYVLGDNVESATIMSSAAVHLTGNDADNLLTGNGAANRLTGGAGNDILDGKVGNDTLVGGAGDDIYVVGSVGDVLSEDVGAGTDLARVAIVTAGATYLLSDNVEAAILVSNSAVNVTGNGLDNRLTGNLAANKLHGGAGADTLAGGLGSDYLTGGEGNDVFVMNTRGSGTNIDRIVDFEHLGDVIALDSSIFDTLGAPGALDAAAFHSGVAAADGDDRLVYNAQSGALYFDADGSGAGSAVLFAILTGLPTLSAADFLVT